MLVTMEETVWALALVEQLTEACGAASATRIARAALIMLDTGDIAPLADTRWTIPSSTTRRNS